MKHLNFKAILITILISLSFYIFSSNVYVYKVEIPEQIDSTALYIAEKKVEAKEIIESPQFKTTLDTIELTKLLIHIDSLCITEKFDYNYVKAVISCESRWDTRAISSCNARGLMQITPIGAKSVDRKHGNHQYDPFYNVETGIEMLSSLYKLTGSLDGALVSYASGYGTMKKNGPEYVKNHIYLKHIQKWLDFFDKV